jgi:hypothetical protein
VALAAQLTGTAAGPARKRALELFDESEGVNLFGADGSGIR